MRVQNEHNHEGQRLTGTCSLIWNWTGQGMAVSWTWLDVSCTWLLVVVETTTNICWTNCAHQWTMQCGGETCYTCNCMQSTSAQHTYLHAYINNDYYYSYILLNRIHIACMPCVCPYAKLRTYHGCHGRTHVHYKDKAVVCTHEPRPGMWHYTCLRDWPMTHTAPLSCIVA